MKMLSYWHQLKLIDNVLYRECESGTGEKILRLVVPKHKQKEVLSITHNNIGHLGRDETLSIARERYYWFGLVNSVERFIKSCVRCVQYKQRKKIARLHQATIQPSESADQSDFFNSFNFSHLSDDDAAELKWFLLQNRDVFAMNLQEMGCTNVIEHHIELEEETPFRYKTTNTTWHV